MTTAQQLRDIIRHLQDRVGTRGDREVVFEPPEVSEMAAAGLDEATVGRLLAAPWWPEMIADVLETPEFADSKASPEIILGYARDVIQEYIWKRFPLQA
ncbi:MAG TPA: hypothetical protein VLT32_19535 [Candidatus Sulfomarinibacteraceae bacterium]|nr:hypothetical protein [Candidatus Sulfomarinibacteraceae bacterium]